jgi:hypothetical protein
MASRKTISTEVWAVLRIWWLIVPGIVLGIVAIVEAINDAHGKTVWFWATLAMTALFAATAVRLRHVVRERNSFQARIEDQSSAEAVAARLAEFIEEASLIAEEIPEHPSDAEWVMLRRRKAAELEHLGLRVERELRLHAKKYLDYWKENPEGIPPEAQFNSAENTRRVIKFSVGQLRHITEELRQ